VFMSLQKIVLSLDKSERRSNKRPMSIHVMAGDNANSLYLYIYNNCYITV
jgi:hypothetical protein